MISGQSIVSPKNHFTPKVGVLPALVHGSVRLEILRNEMLILVKHSLNLVLIIGIENSIKVSSNKVLLVVESIEVYPFDRMDMHRLQFSESAPI